MVIPFGGPPSPVRLFGKGLGDQGGWMLPLAGAGLLALLALALTRRRVAVSDDEDQMRAGAPEDGRPGGSSVGEPIAAAQRPLRRDPRLAAAIVLGGWFAVEAVVLSASKGIVHPYYVSALAPGTAAMVGASAAALVALARGPRRIWALLLAGAGIGATVVVQIVLMHREHYLHAFIPVLVAGCAVALLALLALRRLAAPAIALALALLLFVPAKYASTTWLAPVEGTFPVAGPTHTVGVGGVGARGEHLETYRRLASFVRSHRPGTRWELLTVASDTAAPFTLIGTDAASLGGYSGTDPAVDGRGLARLVARGEARYVLLGGEYSSRGGNRATAAVLAGCAQIAPSRWHSPLPFPYGLTLFDCAGHEARLRAHG
jgi:4-amino-4-deoxy-L-arabinose transferase-like glycosyltransferase